MANTYKQNIGGTIREVVYDKTNTPLNGRPSERIRTKQLRATGTATSIGNHKMYACEPGETIIKVKAIGNDGANAALAILDKKKGVMALGEQTAQVFSAWEPVEDADEISGNFQEVSCTGNGTVESYAVIWISS